MVSEEEGEKESATVRVCGDWGRGEVSLGDDILEPDGDNGLPP